MILPIRAPVRPRVIDPEIGEAIDAAVQQILRFDTVRQVVASDALGRRGRSSSTLAWPALAWPNADLRGCTFHLGSSRNGLVGSPIASEGSRTGFYVDEFDQQTFRTPEEIRKANLRGADLRGARLDGTDFYLVDLRDAKYDLDQFGHLRRCGAILRDRE
jgi:hypothetical protein